MLFGKCQLGGETHSSRNLPATQELPLEEQEHMC
jgi:hypothetical protein